VFKFFRNGRRNIALIAAVGGLAVATPIAISPVSADDYGASTGSSASSAINATTVSNVKSGTATVVIKNMQFSPATLTVKAGTKVTWVNQDAVAHTVTSGLRGAPDGKFDAKLEDSGKQWSFTFNKVGTYNYYCKPHQNMNAKVVVVAANGATGNTGTANGSAALVPEENPGGNNPTGTSRVNNDTTLRQQDIDFVQAVRRAGLWETPAGQQAQKKAGDARVKDIGAHIAQEHIDLDIKVREIAEKLNVDLPNQPNADQQLWLKEMDDAQTPEEFDKLFVARLRGAHGKVFQTIAEVRANTKNDDMRAFATEANTIVLRHQTYLESTGLVDYSNLANPTASGSAPAAGTGGAALNASDSSDDTSGAAGSDNGTMVLIAAIGFVLLLLMAFLYRGTTR
jgi:putative membrane protein